jgi:Arc/MetJ family transcription regulator
MTTSVSIDDALLNQVLRLAVGLGAQDAVEQALRDYVAQRQGHPILTLVGEGLVDPAYDVRAVRLGMDRGVG